MSTLGIRRARLASAVVIGVLLLAAGCRSKAERTPAEPVQPSQEEPPGISPGRQPRAMEGFIFSNRKTMTSLLDNLETFSLHLAYAGPEREEYRSLYLSVGEPPEALPEACLDIRLSREQAAVLVGALARNGVLERGQILRLMLLAIPQGPHYVLSIADGTDSYYFGYIPLATDSIRQRPSAIEQFQSLRVGLVGEAAEAMDGLIQALASDQQQSETSDLQALSPPALTRGAITSLLDNLETFSLHLAYAGPEREEYRSLYLSVGEPPETLPEACLDIRLSREQAAVLVGALAGNGVLERGQLLRWARLGIPPGPHYVLSIADGTDSYYFGYIPLETDSPGMLRSALEQFELIRVGLVGEAAEAMDGLIQALASDQQQSETSDLQALSPPALTRGAITSLLEHLETFSLHLAYAGPEREEYRSLYLSVGEPPETLPEACLDIRLSREQAAVLVGSLAGNGVFQRGRFLREMLLAIPQGPHYVLSIADGTDSYYFGYIPLATGSTRQRPSAIEQFQSLRVGLVGEAAEAMDELIQALASDQEQSEASDLQALSPPTATRRAIASLLEDLAGLSFTLAYKGPDHQKHKSLYLSVTPPPETLPETWLRAQLAGEQAAALIGYLAADGLLYRGTLNRAKALAVPEGPHYLLTVSNGRGDAYFEYIPWTAEPYRWHGVERPPTLEQFMFLRGGLIGDAAEAIDALLRALAPEQEWRIGMDPGLGQTHPGNTGGRVITQG